VFSNGIIFLAVAAILVLLVTGAEVSRLIPLYAIGVFTSFTLSQAGMAKHHLTHREPRWHYGLVVNGVGAALSALVCVVIAVTKFAEGAWFIIILVPIMVFGLTRLNKQYEEEADDLREDAPKAARTPILRRHVVLVLIDQLDAAASRAIQYARTLSPDELRAIHFDLDPIKTEDLCTAWRDLGLARLPLDIVECPDRRIPRAAAELVAGALADGDTEVSVLLPRRQYAHVWHRLLHDRTANAITETLSVLPHSNVTIVPYHLGASRPPARLAAAREPGRHPLALVRRNGANSHAAAADTAAAGDGGLPEERVRIADVTYRQRARVAGRLTTMRVQPHGGVSSLECTLTDETGGLTIVFLGRRAIAGLTVGTRLVVEGTVGEDRGRLAILNPVYEILPEN
jgi:hypothetical protein